MEMPTDYELAINGNNAVICRDFFPTMCPSQLNGDWAAITIKFRPWFEACAINRVSKVVNPNHEIAENNDVGRQSWLKKIQVEVLGKQYRDVMTMGWNNGLEKLMSAEENISGEVDFSFRGKTPTTQSDVKDILFGDVVTTMVKSGNLAEPMALLYKWGYYLTMEGCSLNWTSKATMDYIKLMGYNVELGNCCEMEKHMSIHSWNRIGRKMAINSFQTNLRRKQAKIWGVRLLTSVLIETPDSMDMEIVDIREFLPPRVISDMTRKDGTRFRIQRIGPGRVDDHLRVRQRIYDVVHWAKGIEMDRGVVQSMVSDALDANYEGETVESGGGVATTEENATRVNDLVDINSVHKVGQTGIDKDDGGVVTETPECRQGGRKKKAITKSTNNNKNKRREGSTMAPRRKVKAASKKDESHLKIKEYLSRNEDKVRIILT